MMPSVNAPAASAPAAPVPATAPVAAPADQNPIATALKPFADIATTRTRLITEHPLLFVIDAVFGTIVSIATSYFMWIALSSIAAIYFRWLEIAHPVLPICLTYVIIALLIHPKDRSIGLLVLPIIAFLAFYALQNLDRFIAAAWTPRLADA